MSKKYQYAHYGIYVDECADVDTLNERYDEDKKREIMGEIKQKAMIIKTLLARNVALVQRFFEAIRQNDTDVAIRLFNEGISPYATETDTFFGSCYFASPYSVLHIVVEQGNLPVLEHIVNEVPKVNLRLKNERGECLLDFSKKSNHVEIIKYLQSRGC
jgi:ankyrin repeat protein